MGLCSKLWGYSGRGQLWECKQADVKFELESHVNAIKEEACSDKAHVMFWGSVVKPIEQLPGFEAV